MKKLIIPALLALLITGCSSTPDSGDGAPVEGRDGVATVNAGGVDGRKLPPELTDPKKQATAKAKKTEPQGHSLADAIKKAKEAAAKKAAAVEEYNMDSAILSARLRGDAPELASLEREKKIREEIKPLESSGFSAKVARRPAEAKVDAEKKATDQDEARKKIQDTLQGKLDSVKGKIDGQQFQSSLGPISDMQRVGGGGGAVSSGLDYARQSADLQREANGLIRQLIDLTRTPPEV